MGADPDVTFGEMLREFPARTALFTFGPLAFAALQLVNGYLNEASLSLMAVLAAVMVAFSVVTTQYHLAIFRVSRLPDYGESGRHPG